VGLTGTFINLIFLYLGIEYFFVAISDPNLRLNIALTVAISVATIHNFVWNQYWTWRDRSAYRVGDSTINPAYGVIWQFGRYILTSSMGILLQILLTKFLNIFLHYLIANILAILSAAILNYLINDIWTFNVNHLNKGQP